MHWIYVGWEEGLDNIAINPIKSLIWTKSTFEHESDV